MQGFIQFLHTDSTLQEWREILEVGLYRAQLANGTKVFVGIGVAKINIVIELESHVGQVQTIRYGALSVDLYLFVLNDFPCVVIPVGCRLEQLIFPAQVLPQTVNDLLQPVHVRVDGSVGIRIQAILNEQFREVSDDTEAAVLIYLGLYHRASGCLDRLKPGGGEDVDGLVLVLA